MHRASFGRVAWAGDLYNVGFVDAVARRPMTDVDVGEETGTTYRTGIGHTIV